MKYVYGARKLNETNADDRSEHDRASTLEFTRYDSYLFHAFPPSLSSFSTPSSSVSRAKSPPFQRPTRTHTPPPSNTGRGEWRKWINRDSLTAADRANIV